MIPYGTYVDSKGRIRTCDWVARANKHFQARLDTGEICAACGLTFGMNSKRGPVVMSLSKPDICTQCEPDLI
jgi:hypothetical protein